MKRRGMHQNVVFEPHFGSRASLGHLLGVLDGRRDGMGDQTFITAGGFISRIDAVVTYGLFLSK